MRLHTATFSAACLAVVTLFAASTPAQQQPNKFREALHLTSQPAESADKIAAQAAAQQKIKDETVANAATNTCAYTFTTGAGTDAFLQFCVTVNGNITEFQSPVGIEQIRQGSVGEGYGICDLNTGASYYDFADDGASPNWNAPTLVQQTNSSVKIERTTSDNLFILTQTISMNPGTLPYAKIQTSLKNNSSVNKSALFMRWADSDPSDPIAAGYDENLDSTDDSAFAWTPANSGSENAPYGLMIQNDENTPSTDRGGVAYAVPTAPNVCDPGGSSGSTILNTDGSILYGYFLTMPKEQTSNVAVRYVRF